ncbi:cation:proton antiporter [Ferviditalea candida]|uniref:Cation:proton antiporter n=1 Tax=Ferviditalea candida TaxID=3108399 RepID=A0ABU5ZFD4_9BACL|nr:cation:proton antiporter [Paenibacillaceae bacterium T2]
MNGNGLSFLEVIPALAIILALAQLCGRCAAWMGQPKVVGEIVAGIMLGPTLLGWVLPDWEAALFTSQVKSFLDVFSQIGIVIYMFLVGIGIEHQSRDRTLLLQAGFLGLAGILPVFLIGGSAAFLLGDVISPPHVSRFVFAFYMGTALSITAFPVLARILHDIGIVRTRIGNLVLTAASLNDAAAWLLLALVLSISNTGGGKGIWVSAGGGVLFIFFVLFAARPLLQRWVRKIEAAGRLSQVDLAVVLLSLFSAAWFTDWIGLHALFGSFVLGAAMPQSPVLRKYLHSGLMDLVVFFFLPIYFTYSGLNTYLLGIFQTVMLIPSLVILSIAFFGKYTSCMLATRKLGFSWRESSSVGGLMNARGLMELLIANIGFSNGIISQNVFSILVLMALATTVFAIPIYNLSLFSIKDKFYQTGQLDE